MLEYLQSIEDRIDAVGDCSLLSEINDSVGAQLQELLDELAEQTAALQLQTIPPVDLATTIAWITAQIDTVIKPINEIIVQNALITAKITTILGKISAKSESLSCDIEVPTP